ncbi:MAG: DinB family protein [Saprospiraceae bacterium]|nr:DinB family protein [Saprospiraceae bacterium]
MNKQELINEFIRESENTKRLLEAIPNSALDWKPSAKNWSTGQLASHIVAIYDWCKAVINQSELNLDNYHYEREDISSVDNIINKFEENVRNARKSLELFDESEINDSWKMTKNGFEIIPSTPKGEIIRYVLYNHIYHHRGQLITYLRATGNDVPGLYGPTGNTGS